MLYGVDIGTTCIALAIIDVHAKRVVDSCARPHQATLAKDKSDEHCQDPEKIYQQLLAILADYERRYGIPQAIGISGQMHGILYIDRHGRAVSPLYTWLDHRAERHPTRGEPNYLAEIEQRSGWKIASGYGLATHYAHTRAGTVPANAHSLGTIMDWCTMRLRGAMEPITASSCAASIGFYLPSVAGGDQFDMTALSVLQCSPIRLPRVVPDGVVLGKRSDGVPIAAPIGDNQASFIGSAADLRNSLLVNIGTSSQVSRAVPLAHLASEPPDQRLANVVEYRPFVDNCQLLVGSCLAGGNSLELLIDLLAEGYRLYSDKEPADKYAVLARNASNSSPANSAERLVIDTRFSGTRSNPNRRGAIGNISTANFTVANCISALFTGLIDELYQVWGEMPSSSFNILIGSGGALRRNYALQRAAAKRWSKPLRIPTHTEAAAVGAAMVGGVASNILPNWKAAQQIIAYQTVTA